MNEPRRLSDAELIAQLRRRSSDELAHSEQWRSDFILGVGTKIDSVAPSVMNRRLPAFAGLAAAVAIILIVVIAMPGFGPAGGSPSPTPGVPPVSVMTARDFASGLASGELDGDTVLVTARILPYDGPMLYGATCSIEREQPIQPNFTCALGRLDGTDPAVWVDASYAATPSGDATHYPGAPYVWAAPQPPIEGVLALSVDEFRRVTFLGRNPDDGLISSLPEVSALALESVALDETRVVSAWLTGIVAPISCGPPAPGTYLADLPGRYCSNPSWLAPDPIAVDPSGYRIPDEWLQLQSNAYLDFAPDPAGANGSAEPRVGLYVIAKRLEGSGCPNDAPPCWQWEVVGRVTINGDGSQVGPVSTPSPTASTTAPPPPSPTVPTPAPSEISSLAIDCSEQPGDSQWPTRATIRDLTGLIASCEAVQGALEVPPVRVANPDEDLRLLRVDWLGSCNGHVNFTFAQAVDRYELVGEGGTCILSVGKARALLIHLREDVSAASVSMLWRSTTTPSPPPTTPAPELPVREFDCPHATLDRMPIVSITDHSGLVEDCVEQVVPGGPDDFIGIWADAGDPLRLNVRWRVGCAGGLATDVELWTIDPPDSLGPSHLIHLQQLDEQDGCRTALGTQGITLTLTATAVADDWEAFLTRGATGTDWDGASEEEFVLDLTAAAQEYAAFDAIDLSTSVTYVGPLASVPVSGNAGATPHLAVYQLDGDIAWSTGPMILPCFPSDPLLRDVPLTGEGRLPESWSAQDPDAAFFEQYTQGGQLTLPEGSYLISASSRFNTGDRCSRPFENVSLATSIVIRVR